MNQIQTAIPNRSKPIALNPEDHFYIKRALSENTRIAYEADMRHFLNSGGQLPASPEMILKYLRTFAPIVSPGTLRRRKATISKWHELNNYEDPTKHAVIEMLMRGVSREHGRPKKKARGLVKDDLIKVVTYLRQETTLISIRNVAMILVGFAGALRRDELLNIKFKDLYFERPSYGFEILLPHSKGDQMKQGKRVAIPRAKSIELCPVDAMIKWLDRSGISDGFVFRSLAVNQAGHRILKRRLHGGSFFNMFREIISKSGLEHSEKFSSHSMRRGWVTEASLQGRTLQQIAKHGRWKRIQEPYEYIDDDIWLSENAKEGLL